MLVSTLTKRGSLCSGASNGESRGHGSFQGTTASHRSCSVIQDTAHGTGYEDAHHRFAGKEVLRTDNVETRYTVEADGSELVEISGLVASGQVKPQCSEDVCIALRRRCPRVGSRGHSVGKIVMTAG